MEDLVRRFGEHGSLSRSDEEWMITNEDRSDRQPCAQKFKSIITPAMFFDVCPGITHGFETLVTLVPTKASRSNHLIGLLTVNQQGTSEGHRRHIESLFRILVMGKSVTELNNLPLLAMDLKGQLLQEVLDAGANSIFDAHGEGLMALYPGKSNSQLLLLIKENYVRPKIVSYQELLQQNIHEVESGLGQRTNLSSSEPQEGRPMTNLRNFHYVMDLLASSSCSPQQLHQIHIFFSNPTMEESVQEFWKLWSLKQVSAKVFPALSHITPKGVHDGEIEFKDLCLRQPAHGIRYTGSISSNFTICQQQPLLGNTMTRVPLKEGLSGVIKCLKNQDISEFPFKGGQQNSVFVPKNKIRAEITKKKGCDCVKHDRCKPSSKRLVMVPVSRGISRCNLRAIRYDSAFQPPLTSFFNHQSLESLHDFTVIKPATFSQNICMDKLFSEELFSTHDLKMTSKHHRRDLTLLLTEATHPISPNYCSSAKAFSSLDGIFRPVISGHGAPYLSYHQMPFAYRTDQNYLNT